LNPRLGHSGCKCLSLSIKLNANNADDHCSVGTAVEHHTLYQYQFANTQNIYAGFVQTETPYYQPNPSAPTPFSIESSLNDPPFTTSCSGQSGNCNAYYPLLTQQAAHIFLGANAWGLRILSSSNILIYGAGLYSFFDNYSTTCSDNPGPENCQDNIFSLEGTLNNVNVYCLSTVGTTNMITQNGASVALYSANVNTYPDTIAWFTL
jgi:glucan 1,3-beta-glucosidase